MSVIIYIVRGPCKIDDEDCRHSYDIANLVDSMNEDLHEYSEATWSWHDKVNSLWTGIVLSEKLYNLEVETVIMAMEELTEKEIDHLLCSLSGQYSDGWGEGYEQNDHMVENVFVSPWYPGQKLRITKPRLATQDEIQTYWC